MFHSSGSDEVEAKIKETGTKMLRAKAPAGFSESEEYSAIFKAMKPFQRSGFPTYVVYPADPDSRPILLPEVITQKMVIHALSLAAGN